MSKLREYTEYFAKAQALPTSATLVAGNGANTINKGKTMQALAVTVAAKGGVTAGGVSVQLLASNSETGTYANAGPLYSLPISPAKTFVDGDVIARFPVPEDIPNWVKASIGGAAGNTGNVDVFLEYMAR